ncbi:response regulator [Chitinophagaceae bacterium LB-8]|uniref:histidine kinase n=1 Tax=Paraflavisolibacter caeni TaxID=2982496 RepID=A0A9X2XUD2_9BACT|nr:response regulator [Paraflavisolibacter caeni]MCU7549060.1 response regulator [Paraflavisolibacter caeni]
MKILVVDDREDNLFSIETILEKDGYTIVKALSGRAALKILLNQHDFTLILMDVQMPDMNGFETASLIYQRDKLKHIPIIFITAHNYEEEKMFEGYKMGGVDFIYKPINPELMRFKVSVFAEIFQKNAQLLQQEKKLIAANANLAREIEERKLSEEKVKQLNLQLLKNNEQLKNTVEELDRFAYVASHDLQEPLRKIMLFSNKVTVQYKDKVDKEIEAQLQKIAKASSRMQQLVNDLLKFSRHTQDIEGFEETSLDLLLQEVLSDIEHEIIHKQAKLEVKELPTVWGIPSQIRQLFQNIISNSLKFSKPDCAPEITIYSEKIPASKLIRDVTAPLNIYYHRIYFKDNGIGFDPKYAKEIFVVFKRLHSYHEFEGTGIGLSICKKIVDRHNGFIEADSKPGEGTTFIITLPEFMLQKEVEFKPIGVIENNM